MNINDKNIVAIIPVRGGSKGIPRKNARLIAGKPLLAHTIISALEANCFSNVFVSTDDTELEEIAVRFGASVLDRPLELANDTSTLDDVILNACENLLSISFQSDLEFIATIQATSPLITPHSIAQAVQKCVADNYDTVLTVINESHLAWTIKDDIAVPLYEKRVNRQQLPPYLRETGGIVVCPMSQIKKGSRFGKNVGIIELNKEESVDIDDYFDWWVAEKVLKNKNILFHVVGNRESGLGHVYRALTLAYKLTSYTISFLVNSDSILAAEILKSKYQNVSIVPPGAELKYIIKTKPSLVINDILDTNADFMKEIRKNRISTINFEDQGDGSRYADITINEMYDDDSPECGKNTYSGIKYCCLRDEFYSIQSHENKEEVKNILLLFGGTDPSALTYKCLGLVDKIKGNWDITVIVGPGYSNIEELKDLIKECNHKVTLVINTSIISKHMKIADVAITSAGRTVFELSAMAIPMIVIAQNTREEHHVFATTSPGVVYLGRADKLTEKSLNDTLNQILTSKLLRQKIGQILLESDTKGGINRVIKLIEGLLDEHHNSDGD